MLVLISAMLSCVGAFISPIAMFHKKSTFALSAESGPPQYDKIDGILRSNEELAPGSVMLHVEVKDKETKLDYKPGHVLALEIQDEDDKWLKGPYTITRCNESSFDVLIRVVGEKSERMANFKKDTCIKFGGKFKVPILDGISIESIKKIVFISTGVGVGPMVGAIEGALKDGSYPPMELFASYRSPSDIVYKDYLDELSTNNPSFQWNPVITSEGNRISSESNLEKLFDNNLSIEDTHYHMIGNAQMVKEWQTALLKAGVSEEKVTIEQYFNHKAEIDGDVVDRIAKAVAQSCSVNA